MSEQINREKAEENEKVPKENYKHLRKRQAKKIAIEAKTQIKGLKNIKLE